MNDLIEYQDYRCDSLDEDREAEGEGEGGRTEGEGGGGGGRGDVDGDIDSMRNNSLALSDYHVAPPYECSEFDSEDEHTSFLCTDDASCSYPDLEREFQDESFFPYRTSGKYTYEERTYVKDGESSLSKKHATCVCYDHFIR